MKIRQDRKFKGLKTRSVKLKVIGGEKDYCDYAVDYYLGKNGISSTRKFSSFRSGENILGTLEWINYYNLIGAGIAATREGRVYRWKENNTTGNWFVDFTTMEMLYHTAANGNYDGLPGVCFTGGKKLMFVLESGTVSYFTPYRLKGGCMHMGRVFAVDADKRFLIRWSGMSVFSWVQSALGSGYLELDPSRGEIYRLISMGDKICVYRKYGIDVIKAYGDPRYFAVVPKGCADVTETLVEGACVVCGDKLYFCSQTSVYTFDGEKIEQVILPEALKGKNYTNGTCHDGRYVNFACEHAKNPESYLLEIDTKEGAFAFYSNGFPFVWKSPTAYYAWRDNTLFIEDDTPSDSFGTWSTAYLNPDDTNSVKTLKSVCVDCSGEITICVRTPTVERRVKGNGKINIGLRGECFQISVCGSGQVRQLECEWEVRA